MQDKNTIPVPEPPKPTPAPPVLKPPALTPPCPAPRRRKPLPGPDDWDFWRFIVSALSLVWEIIKTFLR